MPAIARIPFLAALAAALAVGVTTVPAAPAQAQKPSQLEQLVTGITRQIEMCGGLRQDLLALEAQADARAGTPAAEPYSEAADAKWEYANAWGCPWAQ